MSTAHPGRAFGFGAGVAGASPKLWAFTLGAIAVIAEADLGQPAAAGLFLVFVVARGVDPPRRSWPSRTRRRAARSPRLTA